MISHGIPLSRSIGNLPFSPVNIALHACFEQFTVGDCLDTFGLFEDALSLIEGVVSDLRNKANNAGDRGRKTDEQYALARYGLIRDAEALLPLIQTQLEAMRMTAKAMTVLLGETDISIEMIPGERRR